MKLAFYAPPTMIQAGTGGATKLMGTVDGLRSRGVHVDLFDVWHHAPSDYDVLQLFGTNAHNIDLAEAARIDGVPVALLTIFWMDWHYTLHIRSDSAAQTLRNAAFHAGRRLCPWLPTKQRALYMAADVLIPNSQAEAGQLTRFFAVPEDRIRVVPNGVEARFAEAAAAAFQQQYGLSGFVLNVGGFDHRKNQLRLIRALRDADVDVVFIGGAVGPGGEAYMAACRREATGRMHFLGPMRHDDPLLASAYAAAGTFALPSMSETPGRAALEAGLAGCRVVITSCGCTEEYFGPHATYVRPGRTRALREAVLASLALPADGGALRQRILERFVWERVADALIPVYEAMARSRRNRAGSQ